jgi:hypothetical protein
MTHGVTIFISKGRKNIVPPHNPLLTKEGYLPFIPSLPRRGNGEVKAELSDKNI